MARIIKETKSIKNTNILKYDETIKQELKNNMMKWSSSVSYYDREKFIGSLRASQLLLDPLVSEISKYYQELLGKFTIPSYLLDQLKVLEDISKSNSLIFNNSYDFLKLSDILDLHFTDSIAHIANNLINIKSYLNNLFTSDSLYKPKLIDIFPNNKTLYNEFDHIASQIDGLDNDSKNKLNDSFDCLYQYPTQPSHQIIQYNIFNITVNLNSNNTVIDSKKINFNIEGIEI